MMSNFFQVNEHVFLDLDKVVAFEELNPKAREMQTNKPGKSTFSTLLGDFVSEGECVLVFVTGRKAPFVFTGKDNKVLRAKLKEVIRDSSSHRA